MSCVTCHVSNVTNKSIYIFIYIYFSSSNFLDKMLKLVGGGSVINGATLSSFLPIPRERLADLDIPQGMKAMAQNDKPTNGQNDIQLPDSNYTLLLKSYFYYFFMPISFTVLGKQSLIKSLHSKQFQNQWGYCLCY